MEKYDCFPCFLPYIANLLKNLAKIFFKHLGREREVERDIDWKEQAVGEGVKQNIG